MYFAAIERFGAFVITHPLLGAGQDEQTLLSTKDSLSLGNKTLADAPVARGALGSVSERKGVFVFFCMLFTFRLISFLCWRTSLATWGTQQRLTLPARSAELKREGNFIWSAEKHQQQ